MENKPNKNQETTKIDKNTIYIKGVGTISEEGELDLEKLIKRLLKSKYITGE